MIAYKFLSEGRIGPFSGIQWPEDGVVDATGPLDPCRNGVHACRVNDLAYWLDDELWQVELLGEIVQERLTLLAERGRLVRRIASWNNDTQRAFGAWCLRRVAAHAAAEARDAGLRSAAAALEAASAPQEVAVAAQEAVHAAQTAGTSQQAGADNAERLALYTVDAVEWTEALPPSGVAYVAAHAADSRSRAETSDPFAAERAMQAQWLAKHLGTAL